MSSPVTYPKLRALDLQPVLHKDQPSLWLRDPLQLSDKTLIVPEALVPLLALCDGTRENAAAVSASLTVRYGMEIPPDAVEPLLEALDAALLLDNGHYEEARARALADYRAAEFRPPVHAGHTYPEDPDELRQLLQGYAASGDGNEPPPATTEYRGLLSPHIDYERGGPIYARVWNRAAASARAADLAVIFGTDHYSGDGLVTLTRQNYATPFGVLPTALPVVEALAAAVGTEAAFAEELHHRTEHSIELAAVWLHHIRGGKACPVVPILCGSFGRFIEGGADSATDPSVRALVEALQRVTAVSRVLVVIAGDLSHVGPAFGGEPLDLGGRAQVRAADDELIDRMCAGDAEGFLAAIRRAGDRNNVCGVPPIYLALRMLGATQGEAVAYEHCAADEQGTSIVSAGGIVFR